jgi:hypothetical protein
MASKPFAGTRTGRVDSQSSSPSICSFFDSGWNADRGGTA